jgi:hypothetical protein
MNQQQTLPMADPLTAFVDAVAAQAAERAVATMMPSIIRMQAYLDAKMPMPILPDAVYDRDEAATVTGLSETTLRKKETEGTLIPHRVDSRVKYFGHSLIAMIKAEREKESLAGGAAEAS